MSDRKHLTRTLRLPAAAGGGDSRLLEVDLLDTEWKLLIDFSEFACELESAEYVQSGMPFSLTVEFVPNPEMEVQEEELLDGLIVINDKPFHIGRGTMTASAQLPSDDQLRSFFLLMRPFVLKGERTLFGKVLNTLSRRITDVEVRKHLKCLQGQFGGGRLGQLVQFGAILNDEAATVLDSDEQLWKWLNGYVYHRDLDKREALKELYRYVPFESTRVLLVALMIEKAEAILQLRNFINSFNEGEVQVVS